MSNMARVFFYFYCFRG